MGCICFIKMKCNVDDIIPTTVTGWYHTKIKQIQNYQYMITRGDEYTIVNKIQATTILDRCISLWKNMDSKKKTYNQKLFKSQTIFSWRNEINRDGVNPYSNYCNICKLVSVD